MKGLFVFFIGLLLMVGLFYGALKYVKNEQAKVFKALAETDSSFTEEGPLDETDSLKKVIAQIQTEVVKRDQKVDSLNSVLSSKLSITKKQKEIAEKLKNKLNRASDKNKKAKEMAKTFEKMKIKQIAPILRNLDDETVILIYKETSNRFKQNILLAINEKRAASITKNFINRN